MRAGADRLRLRRILRAFSGDANLVVKSGPFKGMRYVSRSPWGAFVPRLLGIYEQELHPILADICRQPYPTVVDVGCAEGYYAVGLALRMPSSHIYAYDTDARARAICSRLARLNEVSDRVHVGDLCDSRALNGLSLKGGLLVCDCEGGELDLLDPDRTPGLRECDFIVETHDFIKPGICASLERRFADTHDIRRIPTEPREPAHYPGLASLAPADQQHAVSEGRPATMHWLFMKARPSPTR